MAKLNALKLFLLLVAFGQLLACSDATEREAREAREARENQKGRADQELVSKPSTSDWHAAYTLESVDCWFDIDWSLSVTCAHLKTDPASGQFTLPVVVIKNTSPKHFPEPLIYLSGGPGGSGNIRRSDMAHWFAWYEQADLQRDLILFDRRGTGGSEPRQACIDYERFSREILSENASLERELKEGLELTRNCLLPSNAAGFEPKHYGSHHSARDVVALMAGLAYERWNIFAVSYGTRLALRILQMKEAEAIDSVILDSLYPLDKGALKEWPALLDKALAQLFNFNGPSEAAALERDFWLALKKLERQTLRFSVPSWNGEAPFTVVLNDHRFLTMVFASSYDRANMKQIPALIQAVLKGQHSGVQPLLDPFINYAFDPQFNPMVFFAIECLEAPQLNKAEYAEEAARFPKLLGYTQQLGNYDICPYLPKWSALEKSLALKSVALDKPTLLFSGGLDPITPARWAGDFARSNSTVLHRTFPGLGHSVVGSSACAHSFLGPFIRAAASGELAALRLENCHSAQ